ncbi:hypothetical protein GBAR_LOCUS12010, partial [Geodia barretti]
YSVALPSDINASDFNGTAVCYEITLETDNILEGNETIRLGLSTTESTESFVAITQPTATFTILDSTQPKPGVIVNTVE